MRRFLDAHPHIVCPPETNLLRACSRFLAEDQSALGLRIGVLSGLAFAGFPEEEVLRRLREFALGFFRSLAASAGKRRWAEKTAFDVFHLDQIEQLLGETCRFVCMSRNALDTVCSMKELSDEMDRYLVELHSYVRQYSSPLEAMAHAWAEANQRLLRFVSDHPDHCVLVRYEDLLETPDAVLTRIFDFLDEPADVSMVMEAAFAGGAQVGLGDWKTYETAGLNRARGAARNLAPDVVARIAPIVNPTMAQLGYEPVPAPAPLSPEEARARYRAMKMVQQMQAARRQNPS
jgi:hypothetical protein